MLKPLISIIMPLFNSEAYVLESINSVVNQTYENWELILIDDASTDNTINTIKYFILKNEKVKLLTNKVNLGAAVTRNKGIEASIGDYIAFLDPDDLWKPQKLEKQLIFMSNENCDVCYCSYELINQKGNSINKTVLALKELSFSKLLKSNYIGNLTGIYNVSVLGKIKSPNLRKRQDWALWLKALEMSGKPAKGIQETLAYYRVHKNSISSNKFKLIKYNYWVYKKGLKFSSIKSLYFMLVFLKEHFFIKPHQIISTNKI